MRYPYHPISLWDKSKNERFTDGPFFCFASKIPPRQRMFFVGFTLDSRLGYSGKRQFHNLQQALNWAERKEGESWRIKRFTGSISLDLLIDCAASAVPDQVIKQLKQRFPEGK